MKGIKVLKRDGERVRNKLLEDGTLSKDHRIFTDGEHIYFPVTEDVPGYESVELEFSIIKREPTFEEMIGRIVPKDLVPLLRTFDSIGDIAVMEFDDALIPYSRNIAELFLQTHKHFKTALMKGSSVNGKYRTREYQHLAGEERSTTRHKEHGMTFELDLRKMFYTPRMANERRRVAGLVKDGETVIDMFCGVGPFSIAIAKYASPAAVYAIDLNEDAIEYLKRNLDINHVSKIEPICGDANEEIKDLPPGDRVIMNLPKISGQFLSAAIANIKKNGMIHYYTIMEDDKSDEIENFIARKAEQLKRKASIVELVKIKPYSPHTYLTSFDIIIV